MARKPRRRVFKVSLVVPAGVLLDEMVAYIHDAVASWKGQLKPITAIDLDDSADDYDHVTDLDPDTIRVTRWTR